MLRLIFIALILISISSCKKEPMDYELIPYVDAVDSFFHKISSSNRYEIVPLKDFDKTNPTDKVVISLRHDMDAGMNSSLKMAYLEHKYNIKATYFVLHTNFYYGITKVDYFKRRDNVINDLKTIDKLGHEIGWHNDLVTLQLVYNINPTGFLRGELAFLNNNGINLPGTCGHGSGYCYKYHYLNVYFWHGYKAASTDQFYNWEYATINNKTIKIEKAKLEDYFQYDADKIHGDYFLWDKELKDGKRWNIKMFDIDTIPLGKKVVILIHPGYFDQKKN